MSYPLNDGPISVIISSFVFMLYVWLLGVGGIVADLNSSDVSREERIGPTEGFGALVNGRDGAEADELVVVEPEAAVVVAEELFIWGGDAGVATPNLVEDWWHDAVMHMTGEDKVKVFEMFANCFFF